MTRTRCCRPLARLCVAIVMTGAAAAPAQAATLRIASAFDPQTMDPHALALRSVALRLIQDDLPYIPLYRRKLNWAMARSVHLAQWPNDVVELRWVRMK